ncbi:ABC-type spermidine/putrescine transport system permease protein [Candidatus Phytoplasma luffae]|uniref:ABC-type spermidine/putrescine transport system permease protein n=1 Tax=Loofah witches'-broom phytoplasma TaxID=35773 RepID=A0A975IMK4_LOWBP|nr:ABC transporter permease subunit [Candidatus Phytoplasma luffae]QTX03259.1 ABC-type spermidine/putrescine transport system permease protein [Candidatus Phytoplasma luffae]
MYFALNSNKKSNFYKYLIIPYFGILISLIIIPILVVFIDSIQKPNPEHIFKVSFTLEYYYNFYTINYFVYILLRSIAITIVSTFFLILIAYPLAYIVYKCNYAIQSILVLLINGTMWINMILKIQSLIQIFTLIDDFFGIRILETNSAMIIGFVYVFLPYIFLSIFLIISKIDSLWIESAQDLGANNKQIFTKIIFPLSIPGLATGVILISLQIVTNLAVPKYLGPTNTTVIGELIENQTFLNGDIKSASAIAINLSFLIFCILFFCKKTIKKI